jgi:hypothetical protein
LNTTENTEAVEFSVSYGFREYCRICFDHIPKEFPDLKLGRVARACISAVLLVAFSIKKSKMPICDFRIDSSGIRRHTKLGRLDIAWPQVKAIHRYSSCYLIEKASGALPIPYRCLDPAQTSRLEALFQIRERELKGGLPNDDV